VKAYTHTKTLSTVGSIRYEASKGGRTGKSGRYYTTTFLDECGESSFGTCSLQAKTPNRDLLTLNNWIMSHM